MSYTRWGRTTCPTTQGTQLLYEGTVAGSNRNAPGSSEYLCLHNSPQFLQTAPGYQPARATLYGTEYRAQDSPPAFSSMLNHDAPCAVCYTPSRSTKITIPGRYDCPPWWTREYYGYLMTASNFRGSEEYWRHDSRAPICVDATAESIHGSASEHVERALLFFMETTCTGIKCPPYSLGAEITCVVCTK